jgi:hypothetical protein
LNMLGEMFTGRRCIGISTAFFLFFQQCANYELYLDCCHAALFFQQCLFRTVPGLLSRCLIFPTVPITSCTWTAVMLSYFSNSDNYELYLDCCHAVLFFQQCLLGTVPGLLACCLIFPTVPITNCTWTAVMLSYFLTVPIRNCTWTAVMLSYFSNSANYELYLDCCHAVLFFQQCQLRTVPGLLLCCLIFPTVPITSCTWTAVMLSYFSNSAPIGNYTWTAVTLSYFSNSAPIRNYTWTAVTLSYFSNSAN